MNTSNQQAAFARTLADHLQSATPDYKQSLNKSARTLRTALQEYAIQLGCDPDISAKEKGLYITIVGSIKNAIDMALNQQANVSKVEQTFKPTKSRR